MQKQDRKTFGLIAPLFSFLLMLSKSNRCMKGRQPGALSLVLHCWESAKQGSAPAGCSLDAYACAPAALAWGAPGANHSLQMFVLW